jgi:ADP-ribosylglycohydrolase
VPLAIYAARLSGRLPLADVLRAAIEAGGDTDTVASIAGQIAGAWLGRKQIPAQLVQSLPDARTILPIVEQFAATLHKPEAPARKNR